MSKTYTLHIEAYTPATIPMARLAEYMQSFAALLGHKKSVHFECLKPGSTQIVTRIDFEDIPKVRTRLDRVRRGDAVDDLAKAEADLDRLLFDDNAKGEIRSDGPDANGAEVIVFAGITRRRPVSYGPFNQDGSLDGVLTSITGADDTIHVQLQNGSLKYTGLVCTEEIGRRLGKHFREPVRVHGSGRWMREEDGAWTLKRFRIERFDALRSDDLTDAVDKLRAIEGSEWAEMDDPIAALRALRGDNEELH